MFGRRSDQATEPEVQAAAGHGKGRPTPKRKQAVAARKQPLVPTSRGAGAKGKPGKGATKEEKQAARLAARSERIRSRELMMSGDERYLPVRDKGPVRRYVRDVVDARWNVGELLLPVMLVVVMLSWFGAALKSPAVTTAIFGIVYLMIVVAVVDVWLMTRRTKKAVIEKFGPNAYVRGTGMYGVMRAFQLRRTRIPRPGVKRGEKPR
ncbi:MAG TPA: DUF3043 domain-containing protein [Actinomycetales bacterium]|nr:DUF3043 domain-containing protein [Actinomycetales bacterium]